MANGLVPTIFFMTFMRNRLVSCFFPSQTTHHICQVATVALRMCVLLCLAYNVRIIQHTLPIVIIDVQVWFF